MVSWLLLLSSIAEYFTVIIVQFSCVTSVKAEKDEAIQGTQQDETDFSNTALFCRLDVSQLRKGFSQILVPLELDLSLIWTSAGGCTFSVARVHLVHDIHAFNHAPDRSESLLVKEGVFSCIDEQLRGPSVGSGRGKDHCSPIVRYADRVVGQVGPPPFLLNVRIAADPKLDHKPRQHAEEAAVVPEL